MNSVALIAKAIRAQIRYWLAGLGLALCGDLLGARHFFARRQVPTINGRDQSGPDNTGNQLPFF